MLGTSPAPTSFSQHPLSQLQHHCNLSHHSHQSNQHHAITTISLLIIGVLLYSFTPSKKMKDYGKDKEMF
jgi:hypothetical protein